MINISYSNDQNQIRAGLVNILGALIKSSPFQDKAARQNVVSMLAEEALKLAQDEDKTIDLYTIKPLLKGTIFVCKQRIIELSKIQKNKQIEEQILKYKDIVMLLEDVVSII